jgi:glycosyltransferase involved in cell wall biosynthesis
VKILVFNWQDVKNPNGGGAEVHFHEIFSRIAKRGHDVTLFCSAFDGAREMEVIDGITIIRKGGRNLFNFYVPLLYYKYFRHQQFDVVIDDINKIPFYTPLFVKEPLVGIVHHLFGNSIFLEAGFLPALYVAMAEKILPRVYRKTPMMVVSQSTANELAAVGFMRENFSFVYNCVDHNKFRQTGIAKSSTPLLGFLGRLKKYKSVEHALQAFSFVKKEIPDARFIIVGDGDYKSELEKYTASLQLQHAVQFTGFVSEEEKVILLQQMHVVIQPSAKEGWGLTVVEANACGVCCIASNVQGLREAVVDGETGLLYEYGNVQQLAEKMKTVLRSEQLRTTLETNALVWAKKFNWEHSADVAIEAMEQAIRRKKQRF